MDDNTRVKVSNRAAGSVTYIIPQMQNLSRTFESKESKYVTFQELRRLMYVKGGQELLKEHLIIEDPQVLKELDIQVEPEYFYTEKEILELFEKGTLDEFLDCLDFAPKGVIDMIKSLAVLTPLNDVSKRQAILDKTGFDVTRAIELDLIPRQTKKETGTGRRAAVPFKGDSDQSEGSSTGRRVQK